MRIVGYILITLNLLLWSAVILLHLSIARAYGHQPSIGQLLWLIAPTLIMLVSIGRPVWNFRARRLNIGNGLLTTTLILCPFYVGILLNFAD